MGDTPDCQEPWGGPSTEQRPLSRLLDPKEQSNRWPTPFVQILWHVVSERGFGIQPVGRAVYSGLEQAVGSYKLHSCMQTCPSHRTGRRANKYAFLQLSNPVSLLLFGFRFGLFALHFECYCCYCGDPREKNTTGTASVMTQMASQGLCRTLEKLVSIDLTYKKATLEEEERGFQVT